MAVPGRRWQRPRIAAGDQVLQRGRRAPVVVPGDELPQSTDLACGELVVVDQDLRALAPEHLLQLRRREARVQEQHVGAELRCRQDRLGEARVVPAQHRDALTWFDAGLLQPAGQCVRAPVELGERPLPVLVDKGAILGVQDRADRAACGQRRVPPEKLPASAQKPVGACRREQPHPGKDPGVICRVAGRTDDARQSPARGRAAFELGLQASERLVSALAQER